MNLWKRWRQWINPPRYTWYRCPTCGRSQHQPPSSTDHTDWCNQRDKAARA